MVNRTNSVFIATSLDGYIADKEGGIDFLHSVPNPDNLDMGYADFVDRIDALLMGRNTFETVLGFNIPWPYIKPVFVLSSTLEEIPEELREKVFLVNGELKKVLKKINQQGYNRLYIDGGQTIQSLLKEDLIDEMIITVIPVVLGGGIPLFSATPDKLNFKCVKSQIFLDQVVQNKYIRFRN